MSDCLGHLMTRAAKSCMSCSPFFFFFLCDAIHGNKGSCVSLHDVSEGC